MIKTMIKFDGREEPFIAEKAAKWAAYGGEGLATYVDWPTIVIDAVNESSTVTTTQEFQMNLIEATLRRETWSHYLMAGKLYAPYLHKKIFNDQMPTVQVLHRSMADQGYMEKLDYTDEDYAYAESIIDHNRDQTYPYFRLDYIVKKYALQNRVQKKVFETPQFTYMRMAMALSEERPKEQRREDILYFYNFLSKGKLNAPTPNFINLGTPLRGYASCCIYTNNDNAISIGIGLHIAYTMTYMSAGCGTHLNIRSLGDPVRNGMIEHQGKLPYMRATKSMVDANLQNGRGGADTTTWNAFDPEGEVIAMLSNPMSPEERKIRGIDYSMTFNRFLARWAARKGKVFRFNSFTAPDLYDAFYSGNPELFEEIYNKYEQDPLFVKNYFNAREQILQVLNQTYETGRYYTTNADEMNGHTPFYDTVYASNLCQEIMLPQRGYDSMTDLYSDHAVGYIELELADGTKIKLSASSPVLVKRGIREMIPAIDLLEGEVFRLEGEGQEDQQVATIISRKYEPEVAMCNIGAICVAEVKDDEEYAKLAYYALLMIDICIHKAHYELPHIGYTTKARMNAGVGIMGLATWMARNGYRYGDLDGKNAMHRLFETHYYHLINASIELGKERGNAPWIHRTRYPEGYLIFDSANKAVEELHNQPLTRDWAVVRQALRDYGGGRFSCIVAHMPGESSSKAAGQPNSLYPPRELVHTKSDNGIRTMFAVPEGDRLKDAYDIAWDLKSIDQIASYAIAQKWCDQGISADFWRRLPEGETISSIEMLTDFLNKVKYGLKSTYYQNVLTSKKKQMADGTVVLVDVLNTEESDYEGAECNDGVCKM